MAHYPTEYFTVVLYSTVPICTYSDRRLDSLPLPPRKKQSNSLVDLKDELKAHPEEKLENNMSDLEKKLEESLRDLKTYIKSIEKSLKKLQNKKRDLSLNTPSSLETTQSLCSPAPHISAHTKTTSIVVLFYL